jgi:2-polyprenyl-3-methyl-5-hydroxy-6-metoxy-1,4-benzoquinol methylase
MLVLKARRQLHLQLVPARKTARARLKRPKKILRNWSGDARRALRRNIRMAARVVRPVTVMASGIHDAGRRVARTAFYRVPGEARVCPACGSERLRVLDVLPLLRNIDGRRYGFVSGCEDCGLAFANPGHEAAELESLYDEDGLWASSRSNTEAPSDPSSSSMARLFGAIATDLNILAPPPNAAVLDIGCGDGGLLNGLQRLGWHTYGIEPAIKVAFRRHVELTEVPARAQFRLIVLRHVLEHLRDPLDMLRRVERALLPGGYLFISVPNLDGLPSHGDFRYCISDRPHISAFTRPCLVTLLARAGLDSVPPGKESEVSRTSTLIFARKVTRSVPPDPRPLHAAETVFRKFRRARRSSSFESWMPVRLRAGVMNERRLAAARR